MDKSSVRAERGVLENGAPNCKFSQRLADNGNNDCEGLLFKVARQSHVSTTEDEVFFLMAHCL